MKQRSAGLPKGKDGLHPRNPHRGRYDFAALILVSPTLGRFVRTNAHGAPSIDFSDPAAVKALNQALLIKFYGIHDWDIPDGYLCPPIPGRADYIHSVADLIGEDEAAIPRGPSVSVLDIGVGANCVYPVIGCHAYGWRFTGSETDPVALRSARRIVDSNPRLSRLVECRLQRSASAIFEGVIKPGESFDLSICNPPFHSSPSEALAGTRRKVRNLGGKSGHPVLNFGGSATELWCQGGERAFIGRMIAESARIPETCRWFTTLVSKRLNLPVIRRALEAAKPAQVRVIELAQGQKSSRIVAWTFLRTEQLEARLRRQAIG